MESAGNADSNFVSCSCEEWGATLTQKQIASSLGTPFRWCPWCGRHLFAEDGGEHFESNAPSHTVLTELTFIASEPLREEDDEWDH